MAGRFLEIAATDAVGAFVAAKLAGQTDKEAGDAASGRLSDELRAALDPSNQLQKWKPLAQPLADLLADGGGTELSLAAPAASHAAQVGQWDWTFKAEASTRLAADVLDADQLAQLQIPPRDGHAVVRYAVGGALSAGAAGGSDVGAWTLKAGVDAATAVNVEWYIAASNRKRLGEALVEAAPFLLPPMSLADQLERAGDFEYWGSSVDLSGSLSASFEAEASVAGSGWTWGFDGERAKLGLSLGVSGSARLSLAGKFRLRCIVKEAGLHADGSKRFGVEVTLSRLKTEEHALALSLSAGLDATALASSADHFLRSHLPDPASVDESLALITQPGTAIGDKLRGALAAAFARDALKDVALVATGFGDAKALAKSLAERAAAPLMDEIDRLGGELTRRATDLDALTDRWIARAFGTTPLLDAQRMALKALAGMQVDTARTQLQGRLDTLAQALEGKTLAAASKLLAPFASLGEKVQARLADIAGQIEGSHAAQAVKDGLADYAELRDRVLKVLGDAQRAKIALTFAGSLDTSRSSEAFFRGLFVAAPDLSAAERLFQALWSGRLASLVGLVADARADGALAGEPEGWLMRSARRVQRESVTINLLGQQISNSLTRTSDLKLQADISGNVLASADGGVEADVQNYWTERHARLVLSVLRGSEPPHGAAFAINGAYSAKGRDITPEMFEAMQRTLVRVSGGSETLDIRRLLKAPDGQSMADKDFRGKVAFLLPISLQAGEFQAFLDTPAQQLREALVTFGLRAMDAEYVEWDDPPSVFLRGLARALTGSFGSETAHLVAYLERFPTRWSRNPSNMGSEAYERLGLDPSLMKGGSFGSPLHRRLGKLFRLAQAGRSLVELQAQCASLGAVLADATLASLAQAESRARQPLKQITDALAAFSVASETLIGADEMVSWPFAAFAATLAQACGRAVPPGFVACAVLPGQEHQPIPLITA